MLMSPFAGSVIVVPVAAHTLGVEHDQPDRHSQQSYIASSAAPPH
jgi:hypothetical protein